jgi:hypothetical protein
MGMSASAHGKITWFECYIFLCCHATNFELQAKRGGVVSSDIEDSFVSCDHQGPDPLNLDQLCS